MRRVELHKVSMASTTSSRQVRSSSDTTEYWGSRARLCLAQALECRPHLSPALPVPHHRHVGRGCLPLVATHDIAKLARCVSDKDIDPDARVSVIETDVPVSARAWRTVKRKAMFGEGRRDPIGRVRRTAPAMA